MKNSTDREDVVKNYTVGDKVVVLDDFALFITVIA